MSREEWDDILVPTSQGYSLTVDDITRLKERQQLSIEQRAGENKKMPLNRAINIDLFRDDREKVSEFCTGFPRSAVSAMSSIVHCL